MVTAIPFSNAFRVRMRRGVSPSRTASDQHLARTRAALSAFSSSSAAMVEEYGRLIPIASNTDDMVFAVNIPPQEPLPGTGVALDLQQLVRRRSGPR